LVFDQGAHLISQQRLSMLSRAAEPNRLFLMPHGSPLRLSIRR